MHQRPLVLCTGAGITSIKLSTKSIGTESAPVVVRGVANIEGTLSHADISDIIAGRPEAEVLDVLRQVSAALAKCRLSGVNISDNALGEKGIRACAAVLSSQSALKELYLQNIGCSVNACAAVNELVACTSLEKLHLFNNMSDNEGAASIAALLSRSPGMRVRPPLCALLACLFGPCGCQVCLQAAVQLGSRRGRYTSGARAQDFKMAASRVGLAGGSAIAAALATSAALRRLDLTDNPMEPAAGPPLAGLLPKHPHLSALILNDLCLQDEGVAPVAAALASGACPALQTFELALNEITREATPGLAAALAAHAGTLRRVNLSENEFGCAGAVHVAAGLQHASALAELDVNTNEIGAVGARELARCCTSGDKAELSVVNLDGNAVPEDVVAEVRSCLSAVSAVLVAEVRSCLSVTMSAVSAVRVAEVRSCLSAVSAMLVAEVRYCLLAPAGMPLVAEVRSCWSAPAEIQLVSWQSLLPSGLEPHTVPSHALYLASWCAGQRALRSSVPRQGGAHWLGGQRRGRR